MAATDIGRPLGLLTAAALALPGVMPASAEEAPERATLAFKVLSYQDSQAVRTRYPYYDGSEPSELKRISVTSPAVQLVLPLGRQWSVEAGAVYDEVSGASPRYYSDVSGASRMTERRTAYDAKVTRYFERTAYALGVLHSSETDYVSNALSAEARWSTEDNNSTVSVSAGGSRDTITPVKGGVMGVERDTKSTAEVMVGLTHAVSRDDLLQLTLGFSGGRGYFSDPYKQGDVRPRKRDAATFTARWNHFVDPLRAALRTSYRYYIDSFELRAHAVELQWVQPLGQQFKLTPSLRYYTQSSASFYVDPVTDLDIYPGSDPEREHSSADQRLSAFGAVTVGLKGEVRWQDWVFDLKLERYAQRPGWRVGGEGSIGIDPFDATLVQVGMAYAF